MPTSVLVEPLELRCHPCGPSRKGRFLLRYRPTVLQPSAIIEPEDAERFDQTDEGIDLVVKCRYCKRLHVLRGVRSTDDMLTADNVPFSLIGVDPNGAAG